jgi:hypothetical protein
VYCEKQQQLPCISNTGVHWYWTGYSVLLVVTISCCAVASQILELAVSAVLDHVPTARVLECSSVFDVTRLGQTQLGVTGLSLQRTYR